MAPDNPGLDLFPRESGTGSGESEGARPAPPDPRPGTTPPAPLAARMRPRDLSEIRGQDHLLGPGRPLRRMLEDGRISSCILWGPPGTGKTSLARLLADLTEAAFVSFSAVTEGVARVREIIGEARTRLQVSGRSTILFCDEIHRFNKSQQDAFLPHVEDGTVILVGATTENPSFEVNRPLLSRAPVFILNPLSEAALQEVLDTALHDGERGLGDLGLTISPEAMDFLVRGADGDARRALGALEVAGRLVGPDRCITLTVAQEALQHRFALYDKGGEEHYNLISALHKSVRGGDPDGALYWLARMLEGGADPLYIARRVVRMAVEDVGLADAGGLPGAVAAWQAYHFLGSPEGDLALAHAVVRLATAEKSNRVYRAFGRAREAARESASAPVPLHLRNAPTREMKDWGYGKDYRYDPDEPGGLARQSYLPSGLEHLRLYEPTNRGEEADLRRRLKRWDDIRREGGGAEPRGSGGSRDQEPVAPDGHPSESGG
ncbi:MAG: replication-associated recombination protein A [Gemmatimonadales bacterium]|nr:MAG: replication-associated recombination protein A [Gemmatimonadales bacterium]